jgi:hypothetical protein
MLFRHTLLMRLLEGVKKPSEERFFSTLTVSLGTSGEYALGADPGGMSDSGSVGAEPSRATVIGYLLVHTTPAGSTPDDQQLFT